MSEVLDTFDANVTLVEILLIKPERKSKSSSFRLGRFQFIIHRFIDIHGKIWLNFHKMFFYLSTKQELRLDARETASLATLTLGETISITS